MQGTSAIPSRRVGAEAKEEDSTLRDPKDYVAVAIAQGSQKRAVYQKYIHVLCIYTTACYILVSVSCTVYRGFVNVYS